MEGKIQATNLTVSTTENALSLTKAFTTSDNMTKTESLISTMSSMLLYQPKLEVDVRHKQYTIIIS
jgi:hypothetical protein